VAEVSKKSKAFTRFSDLLITVIPPFTNLTHSPRNAAMAKVVRENLFPFTFK
jgi:hypothetical protein